MNGKLEFDRVRKFEHLPHAGGHLYCVAAAFSSLKKYASHFFNLAVGETKEKEAAYAVVGRI